MKHFFMEIKMLLIFCLFIVMGAYAFTVLSFDPNNDGTMEFLVDDGGSLTLKGALTSVGITNVGAVAQSGGNVILTGAYKVAVSTSTTSSITMGMAGAWQTLPTTGYPEGTFAYQVSDHRMYVATCTVVSATSWISNW